MKENCRLLVDSIHQIFLDNLGADERLISYIDATYSCPSISNLARIIEDDDDEEQDREGLLELIFFPDEKIQQKIEDAVGDISINNTDIETVADELARRRLRTTLFFADGRGSLPIDVPRKIIKLFVRRLNLTRPVDGQLLDTIARTIASPDRTAVKVKLRNARKNLGPSNVQFLADFFGKMSDDNQFFECLDYILGVLEETTEDASIFDALAKRRQVCQQQLQESERFEEKLARDNIEILMMRGERITQLPKNELLNQLALIDMISFAVFGKLAITL